ncbi:hypothetical protein Q2T42_15315 [Leptolyngbya boryana CZ1]|uniref:Uncharacterized protein n=1 Tax=Leptolyngbya boryana CZ1 TaxID=3060204 RepID=A0AA97ATH2_LEPBY|nr:hypothetical protein [Leptolyngbya boryana]WNZ43226.1 hypothetical protein Q2T42_15315 [Leptolyngbya boryana CZ1]
MNKILSRLQQSPRVISATILVSLLLLFSFPSLAQISPQVIPRIEVIESSEGIPPAYRLVISQPQGIVYAFCPTDFELSTQCESNSV